MGRKFSKKGVSGIAAFVQSLSEATNAQTNTETAEAHATVIASRNSPSPNATEPIRQNGHYESQSARPEDEHDAPPSKRRKTEAPSSSSLLDYKYAKYDASQFVEQFSVHSEVPEHLKKCTPCSSLFIRSQFNPRSPGEKQISINAIVIFLYTIKAAFSTKKDGIVLRLRRWPTR